MKRLNFRKAKFKVSCGDVASQWEGRKGCGICKSSETENESSMLGGNRKDVPSGTCL